MAKRTAVIDIGSNSLRLVVYEKSSRFAFSVIKEIKSKVRIAEGAYENDGYLQETAMQRAYNALEGFVSIIKNLKCKKTIAVATSALRDAPNKTVFINRVKNKLALNIKVISGEKEAYLGAVAAINLLPFIKDGITVDIGGGSTECAKIKNGKIIETISLDLGTIRLKELFFDKSNSSINKYLTQELKKLPDNFESCQIIAIGGTARAISKAIMNKGYPLKTVHAFEYDVQKYAKFIKSISKSDILSLKRLGIKRERFDTIKEGSAIFMAILDRLKAKKVISSGAGIREGVYLIDILRNSNHKFPQNFNPSLRSLIDRFSIEKKSDISVQKTALEIFDALKELHKINQKYKKELKTAAKLSSIGIKLNFYQQNLHSFYFISNSLNYGFTHKEKVLIAILVKYNKKALPKENELNEFKELLPPPCQVKWLSFILSLSICINIDYKEVMIEYDNKNQTLSIKSNNSLYLCKECVKKLLLPKPLKISFQA